MVVSLLVIERLPVALPAVVGVNVTETFTDCPAAIVAGVVIPLIENLNRAFDNRIRLAMMSVLFVREQADFNELKRLLGVTDGNLATHIAVLERHKYLKVKKMFVGKKPRTTYAITEPGRKAFTTHVNALEEIIRERKK